MKNIIAFTILFLLVSLSQAFSQTLWLDEFDLSSMESGWGTPHAKKSVEGNRLSIHGQTFERGVGTHAISTFLINLDGKGKRFSASVGVDDEIKEDKASIDFYVLGDKKVLWESGVMKRGEAPKKLDVDISGVKQLGLLAGDAGDGNGWDHADWADAKIELTENVAPSAMVTNSVPEMYVLTPKPSEKPRINGAQIFGVRPRRPFLYTIAATGKLPITFEARNLPDGLTLDPASGRITGTLNKRGDYRVTLIAKNDLGEATRDLRISVGDRICLTPPMGWNSWNCWACAVDDQKVRTSADAMVSSGLANHGWTYINIDDCWEVKPEANDSMLQGERRSKDGMINTNKKFPDMKALSDYVHSKGLKLGIYSGPGPTTCAGFTASYQFEQQDAMRYADWGIDYLKYDWCSYDGIAKDKTLPELKKPYAVMRAALDKVPRDIVYSLCQYGMGNVWEWGAEVGGNCWRTTDDIGDTWESMSGIGFGQAGHEKYAEPGHWNDPDMLVVGLVGWGPQLHPSHLTPDEQYTHITLWSLLSAPLLIGCDLARLDEFTLNLLTNDEVIDVSQDPLGKQASRVSAAGGSQIWVKEMEDGSKAVGLFFPDFAEKKSPADYISWGPKGKAHVILKASDIGITGKFKVRDVWRQKDRGTFDKEFAADVPYHGVVLLRVTPER
ncbi:MAG: NPCBM/NEW2 domain-containing protein [Bacteroidota bacterium]|jgi:alpha-galactosidase